MKKITLWFFLVFYNSSAFAYDPCREIQILWQLDNTSMVIPDVTISDGGGASYFDIDLPGLAPTAPGVISWINVINVPVDGSSVPSGNGSKNLTTWIAMPEDNKNIDLGGGLKGKISILSSGYDKRGVYDHIQTYSGVYRNYDWSDNMRADVLVPGYRYPHVENNFLPTKIRVTIERGSALAGTYNIKLPLMIGSEEWYKAERYCTGGTGVESAVAHMSPSYSDITVHVNASCRIISGNTLFINHGSITSEQARNGHRSKNELVISCSSPSTVRISMLGNDSVSGEAANVTRCGSDGKCTVTIDGEQSKTEVINGTKKFDITSLYKTVNSNQITEGTFSGNAVATVIIQ